MSLIYYTLDMAIVVCKFSKYRVSLGHMMSHYVDNSVNNIPDWIINHPRDFQNTRLKPCIHGIIKTVCPTNLTLTIVVLDHREIANTRIVG